ncbi:putative Zn finger-like uncharacterized protein [Natronocella acetinitrilica]|uniref:Zn finger-like uncharacterized protein n=1 Tax=Natronocella acetinitrilica TaxID=414046 RepID=A0AAE3G3E8_9GAMM|nr:DUF3426 domain-containing protein [Natronocella acetinitrilica]MCP1675090.1 putative Zn finger-like uncharacterized protein [Natronocella acetinitrilica]
MYTQCPACATLFRTEPDALPAPGGRVQCGMCHTAFDPRRRLVDTLPAAFHAHLPLESLALLDREPDEAVISDVEPATADQPADVAVDPAEPIEPVDEPPSQPAAVSEPEPLRTETPAPPARRAIDWTSGPVSVVPGRAVRPGVSRPGGGRPALATAAYQALGEDALAAAEGDHGDWHLQSALELERQAAAGIPAAGPSNLLWLTGVLLLALLFGLQVTYAQRNVMAASAELRPWAERLCAVTGCELPLLRDREQMRLLRGQVTEHPRRDDALVAAALIVNDAPFRQPYPLIRLSLLDGNQRVTAERWFHPSDYLEDETLRHQWERGMSPGRSISVRLELMDPGGGAEQYIFEYR